VVRVKLTAIIPLNRDDITTELDEVDDLTVVEVLRTGATPEKFAEALAWFTNNEPLMNIGKPLVIGRVGRLVDILESDGQEPGPLGHPLEG
jgi:hypothetical protein